MMSPDDRRRFAQRLRKLREAKKLDQKELGKRVGVSGGYISLLETAQRDPRLSVVNKLARALGVKPSVLLD